MSFTSPLYYLFLALSVGIYFSVPLQKRHYLLLVSSYIFYLSFNARYVFFILVTTFVSYFSARTMTFSKTRKIKNLALYFALLVELILLVFTKYWNPLARSTGLFTPLNILIPLGISFYTFQSMGYLFDVYRGNLKAELNFPRFALFISFFPHLLAGPIEPAQHFLPQIQDTKTIEPKAIAFGVLLILSGLFKKLVISDHLGPIVDLVFDNPIDHHGMSIALAALLARYQIYCDFSGYTDIALGSALMFGFKLTKNFNRPFFASSITEYWKRWHISLTVWIRNYIFYPLLVTPLSRMGVNGLILITFFILGLWHGGTFNFLVYGLIQGLFIIADIKTKSFREFCYQKIGLNKYPRILNSLCVFVTFFFIVVPPTLFFRSTEFSSSLLMIKNLCNSPWGLSDLSFIFKSDYLVEYLIIAISAIVLLEFIDWIQKTKFDIAEYLWSKPRAAFFAVVFVFLFSILFFGKFDPGSRFIYSQF